MIGNIIGFVIWAIGGVIIIGLGISAYFSRKVVGFWANIKPISINDIAGYNRAVGRDFALKNKSPCSACEFQAKQGISILGIKLLFFSV